MKNTLSILTVTLTLALVAGAQNDPRADARRFEELKAKRAAGTMTAEERQWGQQYLRDHPEARGQRGPQGRAQQRSPTPTRDLSSIGLIPLPDLGAGKYKGAMGGLYPDGANQCPAEHAAAGLRIGAKIKPLNAKGEEDEAEGKIVLISLGMSNTTQEFANGEEVYEDGQRAGRRLHPEWSFLPRAMGDAARNPKVLIVDCAQGGRDAAAWARNGPPGQERGREDPWKVMNRRLVAAKVSPAQIQVAWLKQARGHPLGNDLGEFPKHAQRLQLDNEITLRRLKEVCPNIKIVYCSSRTRAYTDDPQGLNSEPFAYESGYSVKWMIESQIKGPGNLNFDPAKGKAVAPYLLWGPYLWADGTKPRSDGFIWMREDDRSNDQTHPSATGVRKVADQLLAFFKTDPTTAPWFLKATPAAQKPRVEVSADSLRGPAPLTVNFKAEAAAVQADVKEYAWTFDDGTYSFSQNPVKTFAVPGDYNVHLTVCDAAGNNTTTTMKIAVNRAE